MTGNLSLGLFRSQERARTVAKNVRGQGYPVEIYLRTRSREEAWIALEDADLAALDWVAAPGNLRDYPQLRLQERDCPAS